MVLVAELVAASALVVGISSGQRSSPQSAPTSSASASLVVGAGRTVRLVSLGGARTDALLTRVGADIGRAVGAVERFWGSDWGRDDAPAIAPEITIVAVESEAQFIEYSHLDPRRQWSDIAAVSVADGVDLAERKTSGQRIVLAPGAAAMSDSALRIVLAHELFHLATRADTAVDAPRWLTEGVADFVARSPTEIPAGTSTVLPSDAALESGGPDRSAAYDRAWWFARFIADTYGTDGLRRLYTAACGPGHGDLAEAVHRALGTDLAELQVRWTYWLSR